MKIILSIVLFIDVFAINFAYSQELLPNGNFEIRKGNPTTWGQAYLLQFWNGSANETGSPVTYFYGYEDIGYLPAWKQGGVQSPYSGEGFIGLGIALKEEKKVRSQYLETKLVVPLEKDSLYSITAYVSLADRVRYAIDYIPVTLSDSTMLQKDVKYTSNSIKLFGDTSYLDNTKEWMKVSAVYKAKGGECYFIIGGIERIRKNNSEFKTKKIPFQVSFQYFILHKLTYYFIDAISIKKNALPQQKKIINIPVSDSTSMQVKKEDTIIINDVVFELNSYHLKNELNQQLDSVASIILMKNIKRIKILGFTDDLGTEKFNYELSERRAKTIYNYFKTRGVPSEKMEYQGLGESNPLYKNNSEEERSKNRRVEIHIWE